MVVVIYYWSGKFEVLTTSQALLQPKSTNIYGIVKKQCFCRKNLQIHALRKLWGIILRSPKASQPLTHWEMLPLVEEMFWYVVIWVVTLAVTNTSWYFHQNQRSAGTGILLQKYFLLQICSRVSFLVQIQAFGCLWKPGWHQLQGFLTTRFDPDTRHKCRKFPSSLSISPMFSLHFIAIRSLDHHRLCQPGENWIFVYAKLFSLFHVQINLSI